MSAPSSGASSTSAQMYSAGWLDQVGSLPDLVPEQLNNLAICSMLHAGRP